MEKSESIVKLSSALVKAQAELKVVVKDEKNPFFKSNYAGLPSIWREFQNVFTKHGLSVIQIPEARGLRTTLVHESGEWISGWAELNPIKNDPQAVGSAITYMRRYALAGICGIVASEDDDDGNAASGKTQHQEHKSAPVISNHGIQSKHTPEVDALKAIAEKAKSKYKDEPAGVEWDSPAAEDKWVDSAASPEPIGQKTISGIVKKYFPLNGKKPHVVTVDGEYYSTYHEGIGKQMADLEGQLVHITYRDEPYTYKGEARINHVVDAIRKP